MKPFLVVAVLCGVGCRGEPSREAVVRYRGESLGIAWDDMPESAEGRRQLSEAEAARGAKQLSGGEVVRGLAHLRRAVDLRPGDVKLRLDLVRGFERLGDHDAALRVLREARSIAPRDPAVLAALGRILVLQLRTRDPAELREARDAWRTLVQIAPQSDEARHAERHLGGLDDALRAPRGAGARAPLPSAPASKEPASPAPSSANVGRTDADELVLGNELMERGHYREASRAYARAARSGDPEARRLQGLASFRGGDFKDAVRVWESLFRSGKLDEEARRMFEEAKRKIAP